MKNGLFEENGELVYFKNDSPYHAGVIQENGDIYYIGSNGKAVKGSHNVHSVMANGLLERGTYFFGEDYKLVKDNKSGLFEENGHLVYYKDGHPCHAGVIKDGDDIYYISSHGLAVKGEYDVHHEMANGILKRGTYTFGDDYKLVPDSYVPPEKSEKRSKRKKRKFSKNEIALITAAACLFVIASVCIIFGHRPPPQVITPIEEADVQEIVLPTFENEVLLCSDSAKRIYNGEITVKSAASKGDPYRPFVFEYDLLGQFGTLAISEYPDMSDAKIYTMPADTESISIDNLKTGTAYYYTVTVGEEAYDGSFETAESTRFINIPGLKNTRDIGGYTTLDGKKSRQGLLIRGTEIDGLVEPSYFLEDDSIEYVQETFGFASDLDLRGAETFNGNYQTRFGDNVLHKFYETPMYGNIFGNYFQPHIKEIFSDLADPANYPVYLHCTYGRDRTGTICFLLECILNYPEDVILQDYQFTSYYISNVSSTSFNSIYGGLEGYAGDTIQEKVVSYLTSPEVGVTIDEVESIRSIFLED